MRLHGLVASVLAAVSVSACSERAEARHDQAERSVTEERERRQTSIAEIAPPPMPPRQPASEPTPAPLPLLGKDGNDRYGYPTRYVDRPVLRGLLMHKRFGELTNAVERLQDAFEQDHSREYWPSDAAEALGSGERELLPLLDAWVEASPGSFAPFLARGTFWVKAAYERRGGKWAKDTPRTDFASMDEAVSRAVLDLAHAVEMRPALVAAMTQQLGAYLLTRDGHRQNAKIISQALGVCPSCFQVRARYLHTLTPRWGGSYDSMRSFLRRTNIRANPRDRLLPGYLDIERAADMRDDMREEQSAADIERACARGEHWEFLLERARHRLRVGDSTKALEDLARASALRPGHPDVLYASAYAYGRAKRWEEAGRALRAAAQVSPAHASSHSGNIFEAIVKGLVYEGWKRQSAGDRDGALRDYDLAAELDPNNREVQARRASFIAGPRIEAHVLEEQARNVPGDFRAVQQLDYKLALHGQYDQILPLWNDFLAKHPDHGQAYLERGGTLFHLKRMREALADAQKACELGVSEGCVRAKQLRGTTQSGPR